jgi:ATP-dependent exoDNAse (exonuclease V) beta subunit
MMLNTTYEPIDPAAAHSSVQMMTVHGAKGLEFDVVFVPQLDRDPGRKPVEAQSPPYLLERVPGQNHYLIAMLPDKRLQEEDKIYQRLKQHTHSKTLAEAKRVLYVALTRARHKLYLSGIAKTVTVEYQVRIRCGQNYLSWLLNYLGIKTDADLLQASSAESSIRVELNPLGATSTSIPSSPDRVTVGNIPSGAPMKPESAPYQVWLPAKNCDAQYWIPGLDEKDFSDDRISLATTLVIHQLLQHVADGKPLPNLQQLRNALTANSLSPAEAAQVAPDLFAEIQQCLADPFLGNLLITPQPWRKTAWALAAQLSDHSLGTGIIDLVVCDGTSWWLVDYKTLRFSPKDSADDFALRLHNYYDDQISHYRQILAKRQKLALSQIRAGFYLTALQRWEEVELR